MTSAMGQAECLLSVSDALHAIGEDMEKAPPQEEVELILHLSEEMPISLG